jgi:uncharacterized protein YdhG (YjbR/CyaY superfamily)
MKRFAPAKNVDEYLLLLPDSLHNTLEKIRQTIKKAAPNAVETISYHIPSYKYKGPLVHFAAFKDHCSFFVVNKNIIKNFEKELSTFETSGATIHFSPGKPLPAALVKRIVKLRVKENEESIL